MAKKKAVAKRPVGRPTKYTPMAIVEFNKYLQEATPQNMKIPTIEGIALKLEINRDTLYEWAKKHKEFSDTLDKLRMMQKEHLTETGIFGGKDINASIVKLLLNVNHGMNEAPSQSQAQQVNVYVNAQEDIDKFIVKDK